MVLSFFGKIRYYKDKVAGVNEVNGVTEVTELKNIKFTFKIFRMQNEIVRKICLALASKSNHPKKLQKSFFCKK